MRKYIVAGLLVWLPLAITVWVLSWLLGAMDSLFAWVLFSVLLWGRYQLGWRSQTAVRLTLAGFVLLASAGFDAEVVERMNYRQKNLLGIAAYVLYGARHILRSQPTLWIEFPDHERMEAQAVIVARGKKYGGNVTIAPGGDIAGDCSCRW